MQDFGISHTLLAIGTGNVTANATTGASLINLLNAVNQNLWQVVFAFLIFLILLTFILVFLPVLIDQRWAIRTNNVLMEKMDKIQNSQLSNDAKKELIGKIIDGAQLPQGMSGTTRRTLAFAILLVIGITAFLIVLISDNAQEINTVSTSLTSIFATIIGFYFGGAASKDAALTAKKTQGATTGGAAPTPDISGISPATGSAGSPISGVTLFGSNFPSGAQVSLQKTGEKQPIQAIINTPSPKSINCDFVLPSTATKGKWDVVLTANGTDITLKNGFEIT